MAEERIKLFANGTQAMDWRALNCDRCVKSETNADAMPRRCGLELELTAAACGDGTIPAAAAERMGYDADGYVSDCAERETREAWARRMKRTRKQKRARGGQMEMF